MVDSKYIADVEEILSHKFDLGSDYWTTSDKRLLKGTPFSALNSALMLLELGMKPTEPILMEVADLFFSTWKEDGRFKLYPQGGIYPCQTAYAAYFLCCMGFSSDARIQRTFRHFLETQFTDGGWRCKKFSFGRGPETEYSTPMTTLTALNAFRFSNYLNKEPKLDKPVNFLLEHWNIRTPISPCHYGMGKRFMQIEYPLFDYNIFNYVYVLSFYNFAKKDKRFREAFDALSSKLVNNKIVVERNSPNLVKLSFCKKGEPSELATKRYNEILKNIG